jgi:PPP4R2
MDAEAQVEVGPSLPVPGYASLEALRTRLHSLLDDFTDGPPFTLQRLAELLLEPQKQYTRLSKLVSYCTRGPFGGGWEGSMRVWVL